MKKVGRKFFLWCFPLISKVTNDNAKARGTTECDFRFLNCCFAIGQARLRSARPVITAVTVSFLNQSV